MGQSGGEYGVKSQLIFTVQAGRSFEMRAAAVFSVNT
jgi:hypothetical protein